MEKLRALEVELERKHGCRVLVIQVVVGNDIVSISTIVIVSISILLDPINLTIINTIGDQMTAG